MERDYPHLFVPFPKRSNSSTSSESNYSSATGGEGQMRWWTNEQCTASPQLFDYVVTVRYFDSCLSNEQSCINFDDDDMTIAWWRWNGPLFFMAISENCSTGHSLRTRLSRILDLERFQRLRDYSRQRHHKRSSCKFTNAIYVYCLSIGRFSRGRSEEEKSDPEWENGGYFHG